MKALVKGLLLGAVAGAAATIPMSAVMGGAQKAGFIHKQPPKEIIEDAVEAADTDPSEETKNRLSVLNHFLFGAVAGAAFGAGRRLLPTDKYDVPVGIAYGLTVWLVSYQGWVPAMNIMPPASDDKPGRPQWMAIAHVVFGASLAAMVRRLHRRYRAASR